MEILFKLKAREFTEAENCDNYKEFANSLKWISERVKKRYNGLYIDKVIVTIQKILSDGYCSNFSVEVIETRGIKRKMLDSFLKDSYN